MPLTCLLYNEAWRRAMAYHCPAILRYLISVEPVYRREALFWECLYALAFRQWMLEPPRIVIAR